MKYFLFFNVKLRIKHQVVSDMGPIQTVIFITVTTLCP